MLALTLPTVALPVVLTVAAYLLGSVCFGLLFAARRGVDLRSVGSGNVGATNVGRALGKSTGRIVLVLDLLKGVVAVVASRLLLPEAQTPWLGAIGFAAALGHCYPIWFGFAGGKGAATAAGSMLGIEVLAGLLAVLTFLVCKRATRRASVGSLSGALVGAVVMGVVHGWTWPTWSAVGIAALVAWRHRDNIARLIAGTEPIS